MIMCSQSCTARGLDKCRALDGLGGVGDKECTALGVSLIGNGEGKHRFASSSVVASFVAAVTSPNEERL